MYYTAIADEGEGTHIFSIYDNNGNLMTNWENAYCYQYDNIYKDAEGNLLVPYKNKTLILTVDDYYREQDWRVNDKDAPKLPISTFAEINTNIRALFNKFNPGQIYDFPVYSMIIIDNEAYVSKRISENRNFSECIWAAIINPEDTIEEWRQQDTFIGNIFLHLLLDSVKSPYVINQ